MSKRIYLEQENGLPEGSIADTRVFLGKARKTDRVLKTSGHGVRVQITGQKEAWPLMEQVMELVYQALHTEEMVAACGDSDFDSEIFWMGR